MRAIVAVAVLLVASPGRPWADAVASDLPPTLRVDAASTALRTGALFAVWGVTELEKGRLAPVDCRWCEPPSLDREARSALRWSDPRAASALSDVLVVSLPASLAAADALRSRGDLRRTGEDVLVVAESVAVGGVVAQVLKLTVARRRPDARAAGAHAAADDELSFPSGHATVAFASATAFGTLARLRGEAAWPVVLAVGLTGASAVAYLRVAGDKHWLTDCLVGSAVGAGAGIAVPELLHRGSSREGGAPQARTVALTPYPIGIAGTF